MGNVALITSTIAPAQGVIHLKRCDPEERLADYLRAFDFYCECLRYGVFDRLVYADNSGYPLDTLRALAELNGVSSLVEFVSFRSDTPPKNNRLYLELHLIAEALKTSRFLQEADLIWKITGRYIIQNIGKLVRARAAYQLHVNFRDFPERCVDFYVAGFTRRAFDTLFSDLESYSGHNSGELILRGRLDAGSFDFPIARRLSAVPKVLGVRGFDGASYGSLKSRMKFQMRKLLNLALPGLWV